MSYYCSKGSLSNLLASCIFWLKRYRRNEKFTWHLDALSPEESTMDKGGQRTATLLVYLTEMPEEDGGATIFRDLSETTESGKLRV